MSLKTGPFLVGNVSDHHYPPVFAEAVVPKAKREAQWARIKAAGADGRICDLFRNRQAYERYVRKRQLSAAHHGYRR